jgi:hypothetical protein
MGSWSVSCGISKIAITSGNECCIIPIKQNRGSEMGGYVPTTLPIFGLYNDYGGMEDIVKDENTKLIEEYCGINIEELVEFLVDGEHYYNRKEVKHIKEKLIENGKYEELKEWQFMWIDKKVYNLMIKNHDEWKKGHHDLGTPEMLKLFGFELVEDSEIKNYDIKRFNKKYKRNNLFVYSDGKTMLSEKNQYIYYIDKGCSSSLATYMEIPQELKYLKEKTNAELWILMSSSEYIEKLIWIFGERYYDYFDEFRNTLIQSLIKEGKEIPDSIKPKPKKINTFYFDSMDTFGDNIVGLLNLTINMRCMSSRFEPHVLYLTPQCEEYEIHQKFLEEFTKINKSYIS